MTDTICGRAVTKIEPQSPKHNNQRHNKPRAKYIVEGMNHPKGSPIRFKSREGAERHIKNLRMEK